MLPYEKEVERLRDLLMQKDKELCELDMRNNSFRHLLEMKPLISLEDIIPIISSGWTQEGGYKVMIAMQNMYSHSNVNVEKIS